MKNTTLYSFMVLTAFLFIPVSGGMPHLFWPQRDVDPKEINNPACKYKILIASRKSDYKNGVIRKITEAVGSDSVYIKIIGVRQLKKEKEESYNAVVIINTCMGWGIDIKAKKFLKRSNNPSSIIVYTTAANIRWKPKMRKLKFDSVTSASQKDKTDEIVKVIVDKIRKKAGLLYYIND